MTLGAPACRLRSLRATLRCQLNQHHETNQLTQPTPRKKDLVDGEDGPHKDISTVSGYGSKIVLEDHDEHSSLARLRCVKRGIHSNWKFGNKCI